jgi:hypothetical protein
MAVPPGKYYIRAYPSDETTGSVRDDSSSAYIPTFFPGVTRIEDAEPVTIGPGQELRDLRFIVATGRTARVSGRLSDPGGATLSRAIVELARTGPGSEGFQPIGLVAADGHFQIAGVSPGRYMLTVSDPSDASRWIGVQHALAVNGDVSGVSITPDRGAHLEGRAVTDDGTELPIDGAGIVLALDYLDANGMTDGGHTEPGGSIAVDVHPGTAVLRLARTPDPWLLKQVTVDGVDATDTPVQLQSNDRRRLEIVLTRASLHVTGSVTTDGLTPSKYVPVVVFPDDRADWNAQRLVRVTYTQGDGRFDMDAVPPGRYRAVAVTSLPANAWRDPQLLERLYPSGAAVQVTDRSASPLQLRAVPPQDAF